MTRIIFKDKNGKQTNFLKLLSYPEAQFDMNDNFFGIKPFNGTAPKNAPEGTAAWGLAASFPLDENSLDKNTIQFIFDLTGLCMYRSQDGSSGKLAWSPWKKIGGYSLGYILSFVALSLVWRWLR